MNQKVLLPLVILLAVVALGVSGFSLLRSQSLEKQLKPKTDQVTPPGVAGQPSPTVLGAEALSKLYESGFVLGNKEAKVTMVEFADFQCPFCARYATETFPQIDKEYLQTGKVRYLFRHFPLAFHQYAQKAAEAAECAGEQGKFWEMHDKIFLNQEKIAVADLKKYAQELELKTGDFNSCLDSGKYKDKVQADLNLGQSVGVNGTPAFFINGRLVSGALPFENFAKIIEEELAR